MSSYSPILEYLFLRRVGLSLHPDLIVLNFDMTDVHDDLVRTGLARLDERGLPLAVPSDRRKETALLLPPSPRPAFLRFLDPVEALLNRSRLYQSVRTSSWGRPSSAISPRAPSGWRSWAWSAIRGTTSRA